ncbi:MAG: ComEA family DNA-binding protein [Acidimicrobiia bacterium]
MGEKTNKTVLVVVVAAVAVAAGAGLGVLRRAPPSPPRPETFVETTATYGSIEVHVAGWVASPGVVSLAEGAIVADAIEAAGGLRIGAHSEAINLAAQLSTGQQIVVPGPDEMPDSPVASMGLISLNLASVEELQALPGVGPVLAERIVAHRDSVGRYEQVEDLLDVSGIGEAKLASIRDLVQP